MLTLSLLRHAKSSWVDPAQDDFDRPLNERGRLAGPFAGAALAKAGITPTLVLCSPAERTRQTLALVLDALGLSKKPDVVFDDKLYLASPVTLMEMIRDVDAAHTSVLLIGHNPGLHALAVSLAAKGEPAALDALDARFPTAALAIMTFNRPRWRDVRTGDGNLQLFWTPKKGAAVASA